MLLGLDLSMFSYYVLCVLFMFMWFGMILMMRFMLCVCSVFINCFSVCLFFSLGFMCVGLIML